MASLNKVQLIGNVGKDPDIKHFDNTSKASFSIACTERGYTTKTGTVVNDRTEWINLVCWGGLVKVIEGYVKKGQQIYVEGKLQTRNYDAADGAKRYVTEVVVDELLLLGSKPSNGNNNNATTPSTSTMTNPTPTTAKGGGQAINTTSVEDDLPF